MPLVYLHDDIPLSCKLMMNDSNFAKQGRQNIDTEEWKLSKSGQIKR